MTRVFRVDILQRRRPIPVPLPLFLLFLLLMHGCGAYFNTYYNANKAFQKGEKTLVKSGEKAARTDYDNCLKISSKLLQFYPESRWVDNTILMVGQCYVRMDQQHRALRKFDELESRFPNSPLLSRTRVWRARSLLALSRIADCQAELTRLDWKQMDRSTQVEALRVQADLHRKDEQRARLLETQERLLKTARRNADRAAIHADMAATWEESGNWEEALRHYDDVRRNRPSHSLLLRAWLGSMDNSLRLGRLGNVERRLRKLRKDERFYADRHAIDLRAGWLAEAQGRQAEAMGSWAAILKDFPRSESAAGASHALGRLYLFHLDQLDSARVYLKRTSVEKSTSAWADSSARDLKLLDVLEKTRAEINRLDKLLGTVQAGMNPDSVRVGHALSLLPRIRAQRDSLIADSLRQAALPTAAFDSLLVATAVVDSLSDTPADSLALATRVVTPPARSRTAPADPRTQVDSLDATPEKATRKSGRIRLFDFQKRERENDRADSLKQAQHADSLRLASEDSLRRAVDAVLLATVLDTLRHRPAIDSLRLLATADSLTGLGFEQRFYLAEILQQRLRRPEEADSLSRLLLEYSHLSDEQASRLHFTYGMRRLEQFKDSSGQRWLHQLIERWPSSLAANTARDRLGLPRTLSLTDSATVLLEQAEQLWMKSGDSMGALAIYQAVTDRYPDTDQAATALLAAGELAWSDLENPAMARPYFRELVKRFPQHPAVAMVNVRLGRAHEVVVAKKAGPAEEKVPELVAQQVRLDETGAFLDPDEGGSTSDRLLALRERLREIGRFKLEQVLE